jgi:hypothetical protein
MGRSDIKTPVFGIVETDGKVIEKKLPSVSLLNNFFDYFWATK